MYCINGRAGTGKSFLINGIQNFCIAAGVPFITTASTGIAAALLKGTTFHSAFSIYDSNDQTHSGLNITTKRGQAMSKVRAIIVDEFTMLSSKAFEAANSAFTRLKKAISDGKEIITPFGGAVVILFGDLAQVPAVTKTNTDLDEAAHQLSNSPLFDLFNKSELTKIMRQNPNELDFINVLDDIRQAKNAKDLKQETLDTLKTRFKPLLTNNDDDLKEIDSFVGHDNPSGMVVCYTNSDADQYNNYVLTDRVKKNRSIESVNLNSIFTSTSIVCCIGNAIDPSMIETSTVKKTKTSISSFQQIRAYHVALAKKRTVCTVPVRLTLINGARVMLMRNIDVNSQLINGARGTVISFLPSADNCETIEVKFDFQSNDDKPIQISRMPVNNYCISEGTRITCHQFPIRLALVTAHKSQGQTLSKVAINISTLAFAHGAFYVALSRVRSINDVMLFGMKDWSEKGVEFHNNEFIQYKAEQILLESINVVENEQLDDPSDGSDDDNGSDSDNDSDSDSYNNIETDLDNDSYQRNDELIDETNIDELNDDIEIKPNDCEIPPYGEGEFALEEYDLGLMDACYNLEDEIDDECQRIENYLKYDYINATTIKSCLSDLIDNSNKINWRRRIDSYLSLDRVFDTRGCVGLIDDKPGIYSECRPSQNAISCPIRYSAGQTSKDLRHPF